MAGTASVTATGDQSTAKTTCQIPRSSRPAEQPEPRQLHRPPPQTSRPPSPNAKSRRLKQLPAGEPTREAALLEREAAGRERRTEERARSRAAELSWKTLAGKVVGIWWNSILRCFADWWYNLVNVADYVRELIEDWYGTYQAFSAFISPFLRLLRFIVWVVLTAATVILLVGASLAGLAERWHCSWLEGWLHGSACWRSAADGSQEMLQQGRATMQWVESPGWVKRFVYWMLDPEQLSEENQLFRSGLVKNGTLAATRVRKYVAEALG